MVVTAIVCKQVRAQLEEAGPMLAGADLKVAATALYHKLELVTGNVRHFGRVAGLRVCEVLGRG